MPDRVLRAVAAKIPAGPARIAIDGVDGAGKTTFADALAAVVERPVVRVSVDDFHRRRALRGTTAEDFWLRSFDYERLRADVLRPFPRYRSRAHDLASDLVLDPPWETAPADAVLILDGIFLQRPELAGCFEVTIFLAVPFSETCRRMATRDGSPADPQKPRMDRYVGGQRLYLAACHPARAADLVVDNTDWAHLRLV